jgi:hypothetical protein
MKPLTSPSPFPPPAHASLYRRYFTPAECARLDATPLDDLSSEINLLRVLLARVLAASQRARDLALETQARILAAFSHAGIVMASLARLQHRLHAPLDATEQLFEEAMHLARLEHGVYTYLPPPA